MRGLVDAEEFDAMERERDALKAEVERLAALVSDLRALVRRMEGDMNDRCQWCGGFRAAGWEKLAEHWKQIAHEGHTPDCPVASDIERLCGEE